MNQCQIGTCVKNRMNESGIPPFDQVALGEDEVLDPRVSPTSEFPERWFYGAEVSFLPKADECPTALQHGIDRSLEFGDLPFLELDLLLQGQLPCGRFDLKVVLEALKSLIEYPSERFACEKSGYCDDRGSRHQRSDDDL